MRGSWEDEVCAAQLLNVPQALKLRRVDDADQQGMNFNVPMNWIIENLQKPNKSIINIASWTGKNQALRERFWNGQGLVGEGRVCFQPHPAHP